MFFAPMFLVSIVGFYAFMIKSADRNELLEENTHPAAPETELKPECEVIVLPFAEAAPEVERRAA